MLNLATPVHRSFSIDAITLPLPEDLSILCSSSLVGDFNYILYLQPLSRLPGIDLVTRAVCMESIGLRSAGSLMSLPVSEMRCGGIFYPSSFDLCYRASGEPFVDLFGLT